MVFGYFPFSPRANADFRCAIHMRKDGVGSCGVFFIGFGIRFCQKKSIDRRDFSDRIDGMKSKLFERFQNGITLPIYIGDAMCIL